MDINNNTDNNASKFLKRLKQDFNKYKDLETDNYSLKDQKKMIRSLMNIRMPGRVSEELLNLQDIYLQEELGRKGIVYLEDIPTVEEQYNHNFPHANKISLWQGDITRLKTDAIVNAANSQMLGCFVPCHKCIDNAIHSAAGIQLREECNNIMEEKSRRSGIKYKEQTGTATLTKAYNLPCNYVIHTVGPVVYNRLNASLCQDLYNCYQSVLECCVSNKITSVAFCCISTGEFHFPNDKAAEIALKAVTGFLDIHKTFERVVFNVFKDTDKEIYKKLIQETWPVL